MVADAVLRKSLPKNPIKASGYYVGGGACSGGEEQSHIFAFIVPRAVENVIYSERKHPEQINKLYHDIFDKLKLLLHPSSVPDEIILVKLLPFTQHGRYLSFLCHI